MKLFEHEGKGLFSQAGIHVPRSVLVRNLGDLNNRNHLPASKLVLKAQVLSGKRGKRGLVKVFDDNELMSEWVEGVLGKEVDGEVVSQVLVEEAVDIAQELFVSITYSTKSRGPVLLLSMQGGMEVEDMEVKEISLRLGMDVPTLGIRFQGLGISEKDEEVLESKIWKIAQKLWRLFQDKDLFLAEINPLAITTDGSVYGLDAKVVTDDASSFRQDWDLPERNMLGKSKSWAELESEKIDAEDHRGVVGRVYLDLPGDIGVIAAGGGASLVAMDALVTYGLKPANYTEFSGNPPGYKVKRLTEIVLADKNLKGAILIGGKANFTDQVETLSGFLDALEEINPSYPIVVRRDGPRMNEAKQLLETAAEKHRWNLVIFDSNTSIIDAVKELVEKVK